MVENGKEAIDIYQNQQFNVILMDVQMSIIDGYEATRVIRQLEVKTSVHTPIIAVTAYALKSDIEKCLEAGMDDHLSKPIMMDKLYSTVAKWT